MSGHASPWSATPPPAAASGLMELEFSIRPCLLVSVTHRCGVEAAGAFSGWGSGSIAKSLGLGISTSGFWFPWCHLLAGDHE